MPDGDGHSLTLAGRRPRVGVAGEILARSLKTARFALSSALQEVTTHDGPAPESKPPEISIRRESDVLTPRRQLQRATPSASAQAPSGHPVVLAEEGGPDTKNSFQLMADKP
jgi:hypothetical protein